MAHQLDHNHTIHSARPYAHQSGLQGFIDLFHNLPRVRLVSTSLLEGGLQVFRLALAP